jgi:hypothetical protein
VGSGAILEVVLRLCWLILLVAQAPPEGQSAHDLLKSSDPARQAWGAELAARSGGQDLVPDLVALLHSTDERVQEQALDALIRLKATVKPEELTRLLPRFMDAAVILAIENKQRDLLLLLLREEQPFDPWWVALNEALAGGDGGTEYWASVLRDWKIHVLIYVIDAGRVAVILPQPVQYWCGDSTAQNRTGFPARALYTLSLSQQPQDTVLISSPHVVYTRRRSSISECGAPIDRDDYLGDIVASVMHETPKILGHIKSEVVWSTDTAYVADVAGLREKTVAAVQAILDSMAKSKLLSPEGAALRPEIVVAIEDQRSNKARDLPPVPPWEWPAHVVSSKVGHYPHKSR